MLSLKGISQSYKEYYYWKFTYSLSLDQKGMDTSISNFIIIDSAGVLTVQDAIIGTKYLFGRYSTDGNKSFFIPEERQSEKLLIYNLYDTANLQFSGSPSLFPKGKVYNTGLDTLIDNRKYLKFVRHYKGNPGVGDVGHYSEEYIDPVSFMPKLIDIKYGKGLKTRRIRLVNYAVSDHSTNKR